MSFSKEIESFLHQFFPQLKLAKSSNRYYVVHRLEEGVIGANHLVVPKLSTISMAFFYNSKPELESLCKSDEEILTIKASLDENLENEQKRLMENLSNKQPLDVDFYNSLVESLERFKALKDAIKLNS